ncbi:MAG: c-type cytochrome [Proteobacteria bacterium]|nr:c-type cytochrome [Pseudomonadota bacterium]
MKKQIITGVLFAFSAALLVPSANAAVDEAAAKALAKSSDCFKCHAADKDKKGPSLKKIAAKYKGKADGEEKVLKFMTSAPMVKLDDGKEDKHAVVDSKDAAALKNLAGWILSQ